MLPIEILFFIMFRSFYIQDVKGIIRATTSSQINLRKNRITYITRTFV